MKKLALHWKILIGMALGVLFGVALSFIDGGDTFIGNYIKPFGTIFINLLKLIAVPLILASLIKGVSDLKDISKLSQMGGRTIITYLITTLTAVSIGLILVNIIQPGKSISVETRQELVEAYSSDTKAKQEAAAKIPADWLLNSHLVGPKSFIKERLAAYKEAGVTVLQVNPIGPDAVKQVELLRSLMDDVK